MNNTARTIKFRAWDKKNREMCEVVTMSSGCADGVCGWFVTMGCWRVAREEDEMGGHPEVTAIANQYELKPAEIILMQYTGLKDKNGKEIYEGDVLRIGGSLRVVEWKEVCDNKLCYVGFPFYYLDTERMSVAGNIYENPELLK